MQNIYRLTVIIPVFNEQATIEAVLGKVVSVNLPGQIEKQIIVVDDGSTDNTAALAEQFRSQHPEQNIVLLANPANRGKGAAFKLALGAATGDYVVIQDADLEYDPDEYAILLQPVISHGADVVYGSRFITDRPHRVLFFWHYMGNKFITMLSNMFTNLNLSDIETGFKLMRTAVIKDMDFQEKRFGIEPEITARISKVRAVKIYEVGISYYGRTYEEGKKINWVDGVRALYCIIRYNLFK